MKRFNIITALLATTLIVTLAGCGSDNRESSNKQQVTASQACIACHSGTTSHVTGNSVVTEYLRSAHSVKDGGAGCDNCHQVGGHPGNGSLPNLPNNAVCISCHTATVVMKTQKAHFAATADAASYTGLSLARINDGLLNPVTGDRSSSSCNGCHNPHDMTSLLPVNKQWAESAHGAINDDAFFEDGNVDNSTCSRCHTATGFRYYMLNGQNTVTAAILGKYSSAKEAIGCTACHTDYSWKRLNNDSNVTSFATYSTPYARFANVKKNFPSNVGDTKLCIPCHAGRSGARSGAAISTTRTAAPFDSHYFPAAAVMYGKMAFINFTSQSAVLPTLNSSGALTTTTYGKTLITSDDLSGGVTSTHRKLGTSAINGDSHNTAFFVPGNLDSGGPCVVCHMKGGHTLKINGDAFNKVCVKCHDSEGGTALTADNFDKIFIEPQREVFNNALALAVKLLETKYDITVQLADIESSQEASLAVKSTGAPLGDRGAAATNWSNYVTTGPGASLSNTQVYKLKGALYNILLCYKENASFVHARTITRRVIYDTIDYLDDGKMNLSVGATAVAIMPTIFSRGASAYTDGTLTTLASGTSESMIYLIGWSRSTGAWNDSITGLKERP
jgi:predicted CXXCH cytochrome family protein